MPKKQKQSHDLVEINWKKSQAKKKNGQKWLIGTNEQELGKDNKPNVQILGVAAWDQVRSGSVKKIYLTKVENWIRLKEKSKKAHVSQGLIDQHQTTVQKCLNPPKKKSSKVCTCSAPNSTSSQTLK